MASGTGTGAIVVLITAASSKEARHIARRLVEEHLAACVNIVKGVRSCFFWQGKPQEEDETLLVVKTRAALFDRLAKRVKQLHSYTVPEIIALPIIKGSRDYLGWIQETVRK
jgi:periplasmic divalent cation tolerance protein